VTRLLVEIDGQTIPLRSCDWVKWAPCGCPVGVTVAGEGLAVTEDDAWKEFYDRKRDISRAQKRGYRMTLISHARYGTEIMPRLLVRCSHTAAGMENGDD